MATGAKDSFVLAHKNIVIKVDTGASQQFLNQPIRKYKPMFNSSKMHNKYIYQIVNQ